jgi:hypothetical protein
VGGAIALSLAGCADAYIAAPSIHPLRHGALSSSSLGHAPRRSPAAGVSLLRSSSQRPSSAGDDTDGSDLLAPIWSASSKIPAKIAGAAAVFSLFLGGSVSVPPEAHAAPSGEPIQVMHRSRTPCCGACLPSRGFQNSLHTSQHPCCSYPHTPLQLASPLFCPLLTLPLPLPFPFSLPLPSPLSPTWALRPSLSPLVCILGSSVSSPPLVSCLSSSLARRSPQIKNSQIKDGSNKLLVKELDPAVKDKVQVFAEILNDINSAYVDPLDLDKITETGFNAMLQSLDPYTEFENPKATNQMRTLTTGNYGGVGLAISKLRDAKDKEEPYIYVVRPRRINALFPLISLSLSLCLSLSLSLSVSLSVSLSISLSPPPPLSPPLSLIRLFAFSSHTPVFALSCIDLVHSDTLSASRLGLGGPVSLSVSPHSPLLVGSTRHHRDLWIYLGITPP